MEYVKLCPKCTISKPFSDFHRKGEGYQSWCKACNAAHKLGWIGSNREKVRWNTLWSKYRIRKEDWEAKFAAQDGKCENCKTAVPTDVDHDHGCCPGDTSCGNCVRGLLCHSCNVFVGLVERVYSNSERTAQAQQYISKYGPLE